MQDVVRIVKSGGIARINSTTLGEEIYITPGGKIHHKISRNRPAYTLEELELLKGISREGLKEIHLVKRHLKATVINNKKLKDNKW